MQRRRFVVVIGLLVALSAGLAGWRWAQRRQRASVAGETAGESAGRAAAGDSAGRGAAADVGALRGTGSGSPAGPAAAGVRRLTAEERQRLGAQIAAARQRAREARAAQAGAPVDDILPLERVSKPLQEGLQAAIPILAGCYEAAPGGAPPAAAVLMRMSSDPELGTVIDTTALTDGEGRPLPAALDECLRDRIDELALPPLGERGLVDVQYTFVFDDAP